ncbi:MAG: amidohydrolase family protein [Caldilineaceae bacterium]
MSWSWLLLSNEFDVGGRLICPGLIDIHIHGAQGHTFNEPTEVAFRTITETTARNGVTSLLATTATDDIENLVSCLDFTQRWMQEASSSSPAMIAGPVAAKF